MNLDAVQAWDPGLAKAAIDLEEILGKFDVSAGI